MFDKIFLTLIPLMCIISIETRKLRSSFCGEKTEI